MKIDIKKFKKQIKAIERHHFLQMTAACDDGSAFFVPVYRGEVVGDCLRLTPSKIAKLAALKPPSLIRG